MPRSAAARCACAPPPLSDGACANITAFFGVTNVQTWSDVGWSAQKVGLDKLELDVKTAAGNLP